MNYYSLSGDRSLIFLLIKQGQTVNMLQIATFWDIYSISPPIYIYIYTYIHIHIHGLLLNFLTQFSLRMLCLKSLKIFPISIFRSKCSFLNIFQKNPLEMNSTHPIYPILIPNTSYVKNFIIQKIMIYKNYFNKGL